MQKILVDESSRLIQPFYERDNFWKFYIKLLYKDIDYTILTC